MKKQYREFNLKEALQGNVEVETTSGRKVKYIHLVENYVGNFPVIVVLESENKGGTDEILNYTVKGTFWYESNASKFDLQMYDKVAVCYVNIYMSNDKKFHIGQGHKTKQQALDVMCAPKNFQYIKTIEITEQTTEDVVNNNMHNELGQNDIDGLMRYVIKNLTNS